MADIDPLGGINADHIVRAGLSRPELHILKGDTLLIRQVDEEDVHGHVVGVIRAVEPGTVVVAAQDGAYTLKAGTNV